MSKRSKKQNKGKNNMVHQADWYNSSDYDFPDVYDGGYSYKPGKGVANSSAEAKVLSQDEMNKMHMALFGELPKIYHDEIPEDATSGLCVMQDGQYRINDTPIGKFVVKEKGQTGVSLYKNKGEEFFVRKIPLIPGRIWRGIHKFFVDINDESNNEVMIIGYYNQNTGEWAVDVPKQKVSKATISYDPTPAFSFAEGWIKVLDVHSHNTMGAFFSGTDSKDEIGQGIYAVIGMVQNPGITSVIRAGFSGVFFPGKPEDFIDLSDEEIQEIPESMKANIEYPKPVKSFYGHGVATTHGTINTGTTANPNVKSYGGYASRSHSGYGYGYGQKPAETSAKEWIDNSAIKNHSAKPYANSLSARIGYWDIHDIAATPLGDVLSISHGLLKSRINIIKNSDNTEEMNKVIPLLDFACGIINSCKGITSVADSYGIDAEDINDVSIETINQSFTSAVYLSRGKGLDTVSLLSLFIETVNKEYEDILSDDEDVAECIVSEAAINMQPGLTL